MDLSQKSILQTSGITLFNGLRNVINVLVQLMLARFLFPEDFGIVTLGISFLLFHKLLSNWGVTESVLQTEREKTIQTIFTARSIFCLLLLVATGLLGVLMSYLYRSEVVFVFLIMGIEMCFQQFVTVYRAFLQKELKLFTLGFLRFGSEILAGVISVSMAYRGWGFISFLTFYFLRKFPNHVGMLVLSPFSASFMMEKKSLRWMYLFNRYIFGGSVFEAIEKRGDDFMVGNVAGAASLGYYSVAWKLARYFNTMIVNSINQGVLPSFSKIKEDENKLKKGYEFLIRVLMILLIPVYSILFFYAEEFITLLFGQKWAPAAIIFKFQILHAFLFPVFTASRTVLLALGESRAYFKTKLSTIVCFLATLIPLTILFDAKGAAISLNITFSVGICVLLYYLRALIPFEMYGILHRVFWLVVPSVAFFLGVKQIYSGTLDFVAQLIVIGLYLVFYLLLLLLLDRKQVLADLKRIKNAVI